jgi:hypothetical protein
LIAAGIAFGFVTHFRKPIYMVDAIIVTVSLLWRSISNSRSRV